MRRASLLALAISFLPIWVACSGSTPSSPDRSSTLDPIPAATASGPIVDASMIPQPPLDALNERTRRRLAPESQRIDLVSPTFTDPTNITNPLFPIGELSSAILLGKLHGRPWRAETTLLPGTKIVGWNGQRIETIRSQFVAYLNGRIFEVAVDLYAQADDGSVWYFGEDAFTYGQGRVVDTEGTWVAGVNGPPAMIMPAEPKVGDVYRTENIPGLVFEQVTVASVGDTVIGPTGAVHGVMIAQELHMDEARLEEKYFAPGYGEFFSGGGRTFEATALAVPADARSPMPAALGEVSSEALHAVVAAGSGDWTIARALVDEMTAAWRSVRQGEPDRLGTQMQSALDAMGRDVRKHDRSTRSAAVDAALAGLDLQMRYRSPVEVNRDRFIVWASRLGVDARAGYRAGVIGDVSTLRWIRDRLMLDETTARAVDDDLRFLEAAAEAGELSAVISAAARMGRRVTPSS